MGDLLLEAWEVRFTGTPLEKLADIDVKRECLEKLEEEMFEVSFWAGKAGNYQWGLEVGRHRREKAGNYQWGLDARHHNNWNPYANFLATWKVGDYVGDEEELGGMAFSPNSIFIQVRQLANYIHYITQVEAVEKGKGWDHDQMLFAKGSTSRC